jgi:hypothetical protein
MYTLFGSLHMYQTYIFWIVYISTSALKPKSNQHDNSQQELRNNSIMTDQHYRMSKLAFSFL